MMEKWCTVSFVFLITFEDSNNEEKEYLIDEEYYLFSFSNDKDLHLKVIDKVKKLKNLNKKSILYSNKLAFRKLLGTRKYCSVCPAPNKGAGVGDGYELAYSLFYTNRIETAKEIAQGYKRKVSYYDYGNSCQIDIKEE